MSVEQVSAVEAAERVAAFMAETRPLQLGAPDEPLGYYEVSGQHIFDDHAVRGYGHVAAADLLALIECARSHS